MWLLVCIIHCLFKLVKSIWEGGLIWSKENRNVRNDIKSYEDKSEKTKAMYQIQFSKGLILLVYSKKKEHKYSFEIRRKRI